MSLILPPFLFAGCGTQPADIFFMLDASTSLKLEQFTKQLDFVKHFVNKLTIGQDDVRVGVSTYATDVRNGFWLNDYTDKAEVMNAISRIKYSKG